MSRPEFIKPYSKLAFDSNAAMKDPRSVISERLYIPRDGEPELEMPHWHLPKDPAVHENADGFQDMLRRQRMFTVAGLRFVVEMGLLPAWYNDKDRRAEALALIKTRKWRTILNELKLDDREDAKTMISQESINKFFRTFDRVKRKTAPKGKANKIDRWRDHLMRLRKAIEFITLTEAILIHRFSNGQSYNRFEAYTGQRPTKSTAADCAKMVWDYLYIRPTCFQVEHPVRYVDVQQLQDNQAYLAEFRSLSRQGLTHTGDKADKIAKALLYWNHMGAPGGYETINASVEIANKNNGGHVPSRLVTAHPKKYVNRIRQNRVKNDKELTDEWDLVFEDVVTYVENPNLPPA